jgi:hypothetical protein
MVERKVGRHSRLWITRHNFSTMKYLALAILFAVTQANPTTPRKSAGNPTQITAQVQSKGAPSQAQALPSSAPAKTDSTERTKADSSEQYPKDEQHTVKISKLPPVTATPLKRDWADWSYWGCNFLLAVVGGFHVYLLWHTLGAVRQQAREMAQQRSLMHLQLVAIQGQVREMQITGKQTDKLITEAKKSADAATTGANAAESTATS